MNLKTLMIQQHEQRQRVYLLQQCEGGGEGNHDGAETGRVSAMSLRRRELGGRAGMNEMLSLASYNVT